jgi:hypothetical protein
MEPRNTHHSQPNFTAQVQAWGENPSAEEIGEHGPAQASGEHGQDKLQVSLANASSRWAWPEQSKLQ